MRPTIVRQMEIPLSSTTNGNDRVCWWFVCIHRLQAFHEEGNASGIPFAAPEQHVRFGVQMLRLWKQRQTVEFASDLKKSKQDSNK